MQMQEPAYHEGRPAYFKPGPGGSQLPTFQVMDTYITPVGASSRKRKVAEVRCPRRPCKSIFIVQVKAWWAGELHAAAPCPYCFKTAWRGKMPS